MRNKRQAGLKQVLFIFSFFLISHLSFLTFAFNTDSEKVIKVIEVEGITRIKQEELLDMMCFHVGDTLNKKKLSRCIRRTFKKGVFLNIKVVSEPHDEGIKLRYIVKEVPLIKKITVEGNKRFSKRKIKGIFTFKEDFKEEFLETAKSELISFYHRKGFPDVSVSINVEDAKKLSMVNININIEEGEPLIIKSIDMPTDAKKRMKVSAGDIFDRDKIDKDVKRIKKYYKKQDYIKPMVGPYKFKDGRLIIPVSPGQKIQISFKGNTVFKTKKLKKEVPFMEDEEITDELTEEATNNIKKLYLSKGYYYSQVAAAIETEEDTINVVFFIFEGRKVILRKISFVGISLPPDIIKGIIPLQEGKPYNESVLSLSRESIIRFYNALGYLQMDVSEIKKDFEKDGSELNLTFVCNEGHQVRIKAINFEGNRFFSGSELRNVLHLSKDAPYNAVDIGDARYRVQSLYKEYGYIDTYVSIESIIEEDKAFLTFKITENKPTLVGKIIIRGNKKTKEKIIRREVTIEEDEPYNPEKISKIKQRLYNLGIFNEVSIELEDVSEQIDDRRLIKDMIVSLKESKPGSVEVGLGYGDYEQFRGSLDLKYRNLGGYNRQIGLRAETSSVDKKYSLNFREPWLFNKPNLPFTASLIKEDRRAVNIDTKEVLYKIDKLSFLAGIERKLTERLKANLNYEYSITDTKDAKPGVILSKEDSGALSISSISTLLFYDTRNNPFDPTAGSLNGIVLKFASKAFASETEFIKGTFQSSWFFQLRKGFVYATSFRGGAAYSFEDTEELPLIERFFLGGRTTVRGYDHDSLGPKGANDVPTGGNIFAVINEELRFSIGKGIGLVTFLDAGNVWKVANDIEAVLRYTLGAGLRYNTPVGPIRIDYGHKLNRQPDESVGEVHFSFGHAF